MDRRNVISKRYMNFTVTCILVSFSMTYYTTEGSAGCYTNRFVSKSNYYNKTVFTS